MLKSSFTLQNPTIDLGSRDATLGDYDTVPLTSYQGAEMDYPPSHMPEAYNELSIDDALGPKFSQ